jgi:hypothetical protein
LLERRSREFNQQDRIKEAEKGIVMSDRLWTEYQSYEDELAEINAEAPVNDSQFYVFFYLLCSVVACIAGYVGHPFLLQSTAAFWGIAPSDSNFETGFFGLLSIVYSVFSGQTFLFLYERQINIVQETYSEVFALELLVQQTFVACPDAELRRLMARSIRLYMKEELYNPRDAESPFTKGSTYQGILSQMLKMQGQGQPVQGLVDAMRQLAESQSRRSAVAAQILPVVHWIFFHAMEIIFIFTFLVFDASELDAANPATLETVPAERRLFFGALFGLLALTTQVLKDLDDPVNGVYSFRGALDDRVKFLAEMVAELESRPAEYIPSHVAALEQLGLIHVEGKGESTLSVPRAILRSKGRRKKDGSTYKWGG